MDGRPISRAHHYFKLRELGVDVLPSDKPGCTYVDGGRGTAYIDEALPFPDLVDAACAVLLASKALGRNGDLIEGRFKPFGQRVDGPEI